MPDNRRLDDIILSVRDRIVELIEQRKAELSLCKGEVSLILGDNFETSQNVIEFYTNIILVGIIPRIDAAEVTGLKNDYVIKNWSLPSEKAQHDIAEYLDLVSSTRAYLDTKISRESAQYGDFQTAIEEFLEKQQNFAELTGDDFSEYLDQLNAIKKGEAQLPKITKSPIGRKRYILESITHFLEPDYDVIPSSGNLGEYTIKDVTESIKRLPTSRLS